MNKKVALVTGASSGIGRATALKLNSDGFIVYAAARRVDAMADLSKGGINTISLDMTDDSSIVSCVAQILAEQGRVDVLVNNAGYGSYGAIEDVSMQEARRQVEVNLFGLARITQLVLPKMRENRYGKIVNISSMGGKVWTPFGGWYHATKFAVEGLSDCLRVEVAPFGVDVIIIEPGGIATNWGNIAADSLVAASAAGAYAESANKTAAAAKKSYAGGSLTSPCVIANCISKAIAVKKPKTRYLLGFSAKPAIFIKNVFGDKAYDKLVQLLM